MRRQQAAIDDFVPLVVGNLLVRNRGVRAGAIDEHVALAKRGDRRIEQGLNAEPLVCGHWEERGLTIQRLNRFDPLMAALFAAAGDNDASAGLGESLA